MYRIGWIGIGVFLLVCCTAPEEEVLDFSDIAPTSERDYSEEVEVSEDDSTAWVVEKFVSNGIPVNEVRYVVKNVFPDRFGPQSSEKYTLFRDEDTLKYFKWSYSDSVKTYSAFYNWLDCYGENCTSYFVGGKSNMQQNAFKMMVNDTVIIFVESSSRLNFKQWDDYHDSLGYTPTWKYMYP